MSKSPFLWLDIARLIVAENEDLSYMFYSIGMIEDSDTLLLFANFDATGGHSGGPVMVTYRGEGYVLIGILASDSAELTNGSIYPTAYSTVVRIVALHISYMAS